MHALKPKQRSSREQYYKGNSRENQSTRKKKTNPKHSEPRSHSEGQPWRSASILPEYMKNTGKIKIKATGEQTTTRNNKI